MCKSLGVDVTKWLHILMCIQPPGNSQPAQPIALLSSDVTFHTATLLWGIPPDSAANITYTVVYWELGTTPTHNLSTGHGAGDLLVKTVVAGLEAGSVYVWQVEASNGRTVSQSATSNFTTLSYGKSSQTTLTYIDGSIF